MTRLAYPDPAYVAEVMHALPDKVERLELDPKLRERLLVIGWYWTVGHLMTTLDLEPEPAPVVPGTHMLQLLA